MNVGWGTGQREFVGYGAPIHCAHCRNHVVEQVFTTYSYEEAFFVRWKHMGDRGSQGEDGRILFLCPICLHGTTILGAEAIEATKKKLAKSEGGASAARFAIESQNNLIAASQRINLSATQTWFNTLSPIARRSKRKVLLRAGLASVAESLS